MNNPVITKNKDLKPFIGTVVGYLQVNKTWTHHNNSFECAAWWEDSQIKSGIYPLVLTENRYAPYELYLSAKLDAEVVDDFFPALWAGSAIGNKPYQPKNIGEKRHIFHRVEIVNAIKSTGFSPGADMDYCIHPFMVDAFVSAARDTMRNYQIMMTEYWNTYQQQGDGKYAENLRMISHAAVNVAALAEAIEEMTQRKDDFTQSSEYMLKLYADNTAWAVTA